MTVSKGRRSGGFLGGGGGGGVGSHSFSSLMSTIQNFLLERGGSRIVVGLDSFSKARSS